MRAALWIVAVVGCGSSGVHHLADGGADAPGSRDARATDAPKDGAAAGAVTAVVTLNGLPAPGITVYFQDADSTLVAELTTGSDGKAVQTMAAGGFVTVIAPATGGGGNVVDALPTNQELDTFSGVQPGDVLAIASESTEAVVDATVSFTAPLDPAGSATGYQLWSSCGVSSLGSTPTTATEVTLENCNGAADILVMSTDSAGQLLDSFYTPDVPITDGSAVALSGTYAAVPSQAIAVTNVPAGVTRISGADDVATAHGIVFDSVPAITFTPPTAAMTVKVPIATASTALVETTFHGGSGLLDDQTVAVWGPETSGSASIDATAQRLPDFTAAPTFDIPSEQLRWTATGSAAVDTVLGTASFDRSEAGGTAATWTWNVIAPGDQAGAVQLPTLPTDLFAWNAQGSDAVTVELARMASVPGGYDAVRGNGLAIGLDSGFDVELDTTIASGVVISDDFAAVVALATAPARHRLARSRVAARR
jgi:hypothetical protein